MKHFKSLLSLLFLWGMSILLVSAAHQGKVELYFWSFWIAYFIYGAHEIGKNNKVNIWKN